MGADPPISTSIEGKLVKDWGFHQTQAGSCVGDPAGPLGWAPPEHPGGTAIDFLLAAAGALYQLAGCRVKLACPAVGASLPAARSAIT